MIFTTKLETMMVAINPPDEGKATVRIWTWPRGTNKAPEGGDPFSVDANIARDFVPPGSLRLINFPAGFAGEVWMRGGDR